VPLSTFLCIDWTGSQAFNCHSGLRSGIQKIESQLRRQILTYKTCHSELDSESRFYLFIVVLALPAPVIPDLIRNPENKQSKIIILRLNINC